MRSKFSVRSHPLHPMLVALPVGLFVWTLVADLVYLGGGRNHMWYDISFWTGMVAIGTALVAALPGFGDYFTLALKSDARVIATFHMLFNLATVAAFFVAFLLMLNDGATSGVRLVVAVVLQAAGVGLLSMSGWLGGEMVFRHHLAMIPDNE